MTTKVVLTARDRPLAAWGRRVEYCLVLRGEAEQVLLRKSVSVPRVSPLNAYAGEFVRRGLREAQSRGVPFEDRSWADAGTGSIE